MDLQGKSFIITGAGSGIGRATAILCDKLGANVVLFGRNSRNLEETSSFMTPGRFIATEIDLIESEELEKKVADAVEHLGALSGFCHCAGIELTLPLKAMNPRHYQDLFAINTIAGFELARIVSKKKYCNESGASFIYIASIMAEVGRPGLTGYSASKGAIVSGIRSMALELATKSIRVNAVSPGTVMTEMIEKMLDGMDSEQRAKRLDGFPLGVGAPEDIANMVAFLFSNQSRWITGKNIIVDGGYTIR